MMLEPSPKESEDQFAQARMQRTDFNFKLPLELCRDRVYGITWGTAIGDALGLPVETMSAEKISREFGRITGYLPAASNKWFEGFPPGTVSDDTLRLVAIFDALSEAKTYNREALLQSHLSALSKSERGWGGSTVAALRRLEEGVPWEEAGLPDGKNTATGNGVAMSVAAIAAFAAARELEQSEIIKIVHDFSIMTHTTPAGVASGMAQTFATLYCLSTNPKDFSAETFINTVVEAAKIGEYYFENSEGAELLSAKLEELREYKTLTAEELATKFGAGSCYVLHSLPFSYAHFLKDPNSLQTLFDVVNAGGDTDSNAAIVGSLLGALHGARDIFPEEFIWGIEARPQIVESTARFCNRFVKYR